MTPLPNAAAAVAGLAADLAAVPEDLAAGLLVGLVLVYFLADDISSVMSGEKEANLEPVKVSSEVVDKLDGARGSMKESIDKILK